MVPDGVTFSGRRGEGSGAGGNGPEGLVARVGWCRLSRELGAGGWLAPNFALSPAGTEVVV